MTPPRDPHNLEGTGRIVRFGFGLLGGLIVAFAFRLYGTSWLNWMLVVLVMVICALLAVRYGDRFWYWLSDRLR